MSVFTNFWLDSMNEGAAASFGRPSDDGDHHTHNGFLDPSTVVSKDIGLACTRREIVDDDVGSG